MPASTRVQSCTGTDDSSPRIAHHFTAERSLRHPPLASRRRLRLPDLSRLLTPRSVRAAGPLTTAADRRHPLHLVDLVSKLRGPFKLQVLRRLQHFLFEEPD